MFGAAFPTLTNLAKGLPVGYPREIRRSVERILEYGQESVDRYWKLWEATPETVKPTLMENVYGAVRDGQVRSSQLRRDAGGYIVAGTDTTAITATNVIWQLATHSNVQKELIDELRMAGLLSGANMEHRDSELKKLKVLGNVINETLRLYCPIAESFPRVVRDGSITLGGYALPAGTIVGAQPYSLHRIEGIWDNALLYV